MPFRYLDPFRLISSLAMTSVLLGSVVTAQKTVPHLPEQFHDYVDYAVTQLPDHFQAPSVQVHNNTPADNPITNAGATLGRVLFYDKRLSHNQSIACASCHQQSTGFGDTAVLSQGVNGQTGRHSMALSNVGYYKRGSAFWDERASSLEEQALMPIQDPVEMNLDLPTLVTRLENTPFYAALFEAAFGTPEVNSDRIAKALAQFERSMVSYQSPYDQIIGVNGPDPNQMTRLEQRGHALFHGEGQCAGCHESEAHVANRPSNIGLDPVDTDDGAGNGEFKSPSLRNVAVRGRFMHDGRFSSLEEVMDFYSTGVNRDNPNVDRRVLVLPEFSQQDQDALVAFMQMLTDTYFLTDEKFADPFVFACDYDADGSCELADLNTLLAAGPVAGGVMIDETNRRYDINDDGQLSNEDVAMWLSEAALVDGLPTPYQIGDANLDGTVDGEDFRLWSATKFTSTTAWDQGDFNGDGVADGQDFLLWNRAKSSAPNRLSSVPEPGWSWYLSGLLFVFLRQVRRSSDSRR